MLLAISATFLLVQIFVPLVRAFMPLWSELNTNIQRVLSSIYFLGMTGLIVYAFFFTDGISQYIQSGVAFLFLGGGLLVLHRDKYSSAQVTLMALGSYLIAGLSIFGIVFGVLLVLAGVFFERLVQAGSEGEEKYAKQNLSPQKTNLKWPADSAKSSKKSERNRVPESAMLPRRSVDDILSTAPSNRPKFSPGNTVDEKKHTISSQDVAKQNRKEDTNNNSTGENMQTNQSSHSGALPQRPQAPKSFLRNTPTIKPKVQDNNSDLLGDDSLKAPTTSDFLASAPEAQNPIPKNAGQQNLEFENSAALELEDWNDNAEEVVFATEAKTVENSAKGFVKHRIEMDGEQEVELLVQNKDNLALDQQMDEIIEQDELSKVFTFRGREQQDYVRSPLQPMKKNHFKGEIKVEDFTEEESIFSFRQRDQADVANLAKPKRSYEFFDSWGIKREETSLQFYPFHLPVLEKCHAIEGKGNFHMQFRQL